MSIYFCNGLVLHTYNMFAPRQRPETYWWKNTIQVDVGISLAILFGFKSNSMYTDVTWTTWTPISDEKTDYFLDLCCFFTILTVVLMFVIALLAVFCLFKFILLSSRWIITSSNHLGALFTHWRVNIELFSDRFKKDVVCIIVLRHREIFVFSSLIGE